MGLACWVWKGVEPVLYERRKINVAGGVGRETGASLSSENSLQGGNQVLEASVWEEKVS